MERFLSGRRRTGDIFERTRLGFEQMMEHLMDLQCREAAFVVHGGTIMAVLSAFSQTGGEFYDWQVSNGSGYSAIAEEEKEGESSVDKLTLMNFEPEEEVAVGLLVPKYMTSILYGAFVEAVASENGARMQAMDSATNNAEEIIETWH